MLRHRNAGRLAIPLVAALVLGCQQSPAASTPAATRAPTGTPPSVLPSATPVATLSVVEDFGPLAPGMWAVDVGSVRATFEIPAVGWQLNVVPNTIWHAGSEGRFSFSTVDNVYDDPCDPGAFRDPPIGPAVEDLAVVLAGLPGVDAKAPVDVTIDGYRGRYVDLTVAAGATPCGEQGMFLWESTREPAPLDYGARSRFWILDVDGTRLVIHAVIRDGLSAEARAQLEQILASIQIEA